MLKNSNDGLVKSWSPLKVWEPFYKGGKAQYSKDGKVFVCEYDGNIKIVPTDDPSNAQNLIEDPSQHEAITMFSLHPNASEIVVATEKFSLMHWDIGTKNCIKTIKAHRMPILCMDYDPTGTLVATGSADKSIRVWDILKGYCTHNFQQHSDIVRSLLFHPDPSRLELYSTSDDNTINTYDLRDNACTAQFKEHVSVPTQVALSDDGYLLASCGRDRVLNFYELRQLAHIKTVPIMEELESVLFLPPKQSLQLLAALEVIPAAVTTTKSGKKGEKAKADMVVVAQPSLSQVLVTAGAKGVLRFYHIQMNGKDMSTFQCLSLWQLPLSPLYDYPSLSDDIMTLKAVHSIYWHEQKEEVIAITNDFNICGFTIDQIHDYGKQQLEKSSKASMGILSSPSTTSSSAILTPNSLLIGSHGDILDMITIPSATSTAVQGSGKMAVVTNSPQLRILTTDTMQCDVLEGHSDIILAVDVSSDGNWLVTSSKDKTCRVWYIPTSQCVAVGEGHVEAIGAITMCHHPGSYSAKKVYVFTGAGDKILKRWHLPLSSLLPSSSTTSTIKKLAASESIRAHDKDINCVALSPTDQLLASASQDKSIRLWNSEDLTPIKTLTGHKRGIWKVLFSSIEKTLVSCSGDRTVRIWSLVDYSTIRTLEGHTASVLNAKYVNSGLQLLTCSADGLIRCWTVRTGDCEVILDKHEDRVWALEVQDEGLDRKRLHTKAVPTIGAGEEEEENDSDEDKEKKEATVEDAKEVVVEEEDAPLTGERYFYSAGSDGRIIQWMDTTETIAEEKLKLQEDQLVLEQSLSNQLRQKKYLPALKTALSLQNENKVLSIFQTILSDVMHPLLLDEMALFGEDYDQFHTSSSTAASSSSKPRITIVDKHKRLIRHYLQAFTDEEMSCMIQYAKEWNTLSQFSYLSQLLIDGFCVTKGVKPLLSVQVMKEGVEGYQAYTERHYTRLHRLSQSCHFLDYVTANITGIFPISLSASVLAAKKRLTTTSDVEEKEEGMTSQEEGGERDGEDWQGYWLEEKVGVKRAVVDAVVVPAVTNAVVEEVVALVGDEKSDKKRKVAVVAEETEEGKRSSRRKK